MLKFSIKALALIAIIFTSCSKKQRIVNDEINLSVIPQPNEIIVFDKHFVLNNDTKIIATNTTQTQVAKTFIEQLQNDFDIKCELASELNPNSIHLIDVRELHEFNAGHIDGAQLIPLGTIEDSFSLYIPQKDTKIFIYCRSGNRSAEAAKKLVSMGYTNVFDIGGIITWEYGIVR